MRDDIYTLPKIVFVAGQSSTFNWRIYDSSGDNFDCSECSGNLAVIEYDDKTGDALLSKDLTFTSENDDGVYNIASATLSPSDTLDWDGKYVYQLTIVDASGSAEIPNKGIMLVSNNINPSFLG